MLAELLKLMAGGCTDSTLADVFRPTAVVESCGQIIFWLIIPLTCDITPDFGSACPLVMCLCTDAVWNAVMNFCIHGSDLYLSVYQYYNNITVPYIYSAHSDIHWSSRHYSPGWVLASSTTSGVPRNFVRGGFNKFSLGQREWGCSSPLVRGSGGSCNLVQEISFHIVKFS